MGHGKSLAAASGLSFGRSQCRDINLKPVVAALGNGHTIGGDTELAQFNRHLTGHCVMLACLLCTIPFQLRRVKCLHLRQGKLKARGVSLRLRPLARLSVLRDNGVVSFLALFHYAQLS